MKFLTLLIGFGLFPLWLVPWVSCLKFLPAQGHIVSRGCLRFTFRSMIPLDWLCVCYELGINAIFFLPWHQFDPVALTEGSPIALPCPSVRKRPFSEQDVSISALAPV